MPDPFTESAYHLLTVIDFLCLAGGTYLLLILHDRTRRSGHLLIAAGLAVLTLQIIPEHLSATAPELRFAGATLALGVACLLIASGTLALIEDRRKYPEGPIRRVAMLAAAAVAVLGTFFVWALPFWEPLRTIITGAAADSAFVTFQHGLRVGVAAAFVACAWITWERRVLRPEVSRMFGAAYVCWAVYLIIGVTTIAPPAGALWLAKGIKVVGSLFIGNALVLYVHRAERTAARRQKRLELIDRVTSAAISAPHLQQMAEEATEQVRELMHARVVTTYLLDQGEGGNLRVAHTTDPRTDLPDELAVDDGHPVARALIERQPVSLGMSHGEGAEAVSVQAVAVPLRGLSRTMGVMVVAIEATDEQGQDEIDALTRAGAQLGVIMHHMVLLEETSQARDRWRQTFDSITELLTVHDADGRIVQANQAALDFAGMSKPEVVGRTMGGVFGLSCDAQEEMLRTCVLTGEAPEVAMHRMRGRVYQVQITPLHDNGRGVTGCVRVARDVTSRWRAEERLAHSERRYRELAEGANDIIYTHDLDGNFLYVNPAAVRILGYSQDQLSSLKFWDIVAPESMATARSYVERLLADNLQEDQIELRLISEDNRVAVVQLRANMLRHTGQSDVVHGIARDVTAEKQLTTQLIQADRLASVGTLIAGVAHELNNPLTAISGYAEMLSSQVDGREETTAISTIVREAERCRDVARNLLNFARQSGGQPTEFDFNTVTRGVIDLRAYDLRAAKIDVSLDLQDGIPPVIGEYGQIQQVIYNVVDNACYALDRAGGGMLEIATWAEGERVYLRVADNGPGVQENLIGRIFEPFVTTKPRGEGTGLGLSICRGILEMHDGDISANNRPGGGASFVAWLPASGSGPASEPVEDESGEQSEEANVSEGPTKVLFVDDEPSLCSLVEEYLVRQGHDVTVAHTGEEGLALAVEEDFDVIVCDMRLPGISGEELCTALLEEKPGAAERIVIATGDVLSPQTQAFFDRTGLPHLHKPFKLDQLRTAIARLSKGRPMEKL